MDYSGPYFVLTIIAMSTIGWMFTTWVRARHGYPVTDDCGATIGREAPDTLRKLELLGTENGRLKDQVLRLEERIAVLERIATDRSTLLANEIEHLR